MTKALKNYLKKILPQELRWKAKVYKNWGKILPIFADQTTIEQIQNDLIIIGVSHPTIAQELFFLSEQIKNKINNLLDKPRINKIQFRIKEKHFKKSKKDKKKRTAIFSISSISTIENTQLKHLEKIKDKKLRKEIMKFYIQCKKKSLYTKE